MMPTMFQRLPLGHHPEMLGTLKPVRAAEAKRAALAAAAARSTG